MRALLYPLLLAATVRPLGAQRVLALGDTIQLDYRVSAPFLGRVELLRLEGVLGQVTADSVVLHDTTGPRAMARKDVFSVRRLSGRGYDWNKAAVPMVAGGVLGMILGAAAVADDESLSGTESALGIAAYTVVGAVPGFKKGLDSRGRTGFTIGALVGAAAGIAVGIQTMPERAPRALPCDPSTQLCFDLNLPNLEGLYVVAIMVAGASAGGLIGGIVGSTKPGKRWEKLPLPPTTLALRPLPGGRVGLGMSLAIH